MHTRSILSVIDLFCTFVFLLPVLLIPLVFTSFNTDTIVMKETIFQFSMAYLVLCVPLLWYRWQKAANRSLSMTLPVDMVVALFSLLIYFTCSYLFISPHPRSAHELIRWITYIGIAFATMFFAQRPRMAERYIFLTLFTSLVVSIYAICQSLEIDFFEWDTFAWGEGVRRVTASMGNPDYLAGYLVALIPLTLTLLFIQGGIKRFLAGTVLILQTVAMILTYSRGGWVSLFITLLVLLSCLTYINWMRDPVLFRPVISLRMAISLLTIVMCFAIFLVFLFWNEITAALYRLSQLEKGVSVATRPYFYRGALAMIAAKPLFGHGIGTFAIHFPEYRPTELATYLPFKEFYVDHAHNEYLEITSETGIIGLILYALILFLMTRSMWKTILQNRTRSNLILLGFWAGIVGILIHNLFTVTLRYTPTAFLLWSFLGMILGKSETLLPDQVRWKKKIAFAFVFLLPLFSPLVMTASTRYYVGDYLIRSSYDFLGKVNPKQTMISNRKRLEKALILLHKGERLSPDQVRTHFWIGLTYYHALDYQQATEAYIKLDRLQKDFTSTCLNIGISYLKQAGLLGNPGYLPKEVELFPSLAKKCIEKAIPWFERCVYNDPTLPDHYFLLGHCYFWLEKPNLAEEYVTKSLELAQNRPFQTEQLNRERAKTLLQQIRQQLGTNLETIFQLPYETYSPFDKLD